MKTSMRRRKCLSLSKCEGISIVEMVTVVVILGILAAVALPNYGGFGESAAKSAANGIAGAAAAAAANNAAACKGCTSSCKTITCATLISQLNLNVPSEASIDSSCQVHYNNQVSDAFTLQTPTSLPSSCN